MKRIFIAVKTDPGSDLIRMLSSLKSLLAGEKIKWVDPSNIHLTLAFLGDTEEGRIKTLGTILRQKCTGFGNFEFVLAGAGVFKNYHDPRVIWTGIQSPEKLVMLNSLITEGLRENGFETEDREFNPHLTLGRIKSIEDTNNLKKILESYSQVVFQTVRVKEVILFESILMQTGPLYKPLGVFKLS
jgi:2'-5' RNA ligase